MTPPNQIESETYFSRQRKHLGLFGLSNSRCFYLVVTELAPLGLRKLEQHNRASSIVTIKPTDLIRKIFFLPQDIFPFQLLI